MAKENKRRSLGRGLSALLGEETASVVEERSFDEDQANNSADVIPVNKGNQKTVSISKLIPGKYQPRHLFDEEAIQSLAASIKEKGILQPILVRPHPLHIGEFEIIAGERRWQAAQQAQLHEVPVIVKEMDDKEAAEIALVENLQRQDLSPLEEAEGYRRLMDEFSHTQDALSKALGKSRSHVANMMRLLALPNDVKSYLEGGSLSVGHARALLNCDQPLEIANQVIKKGLNVRQTEKLVKSAGVEGRPNKAKREKDADTVALEQDLTNLLGLKVSIANGPRGGSVTLQYGSLEQLDDILHRLSHGSHGRKEDNQEDLDPVNDMDIEEELNKL